MLGKAVGIRDPVIDKHASQMEEILIQRPPGDVSHPSLRVECERVDLQPSLDEPSFLGREVGIDASANT